MYKSIQNPNLKQQKQAEEHFDSTCCNLDIFFLTTDNKNKK